MVHSRRAIELLQQVRQFHRQPPLVRAPAVAREFVGPLGPPRRHPRGNRFDDEQCRPGASRFPQLRPNRRPRTLVELVDHPPGDDCPDRPRHGDGGGVAAAGAVREAERPVGVRGFLEGPGQGVDRDDGGDFGPGGPRGARGAGAAPQVEERGLRWQPRVEVVHDGRDGQVVQRAVVERVGGPLAGRVQRAALAEAGAALDIPRRQRAHGACDFRKAQVGQVSGLQVVEPRRKTRGGHRLLSWRARCS